VLIISPFSLAAKKLSDVNNPSSPPCDPSERVGTSNVCGGLQNIKDGFVDSVIL
jgi:hypothetical protein